MSLVRVKLNHIIEMMTWFDSKQDLIGWAGPQFEFPYSTSSFIRDIRLDKLASFSLIERNNLVGFGQCYERLGYLHLGRLVISPSYRGKGKAIELINAVADAGFKIIDAKGLSLFVYQDNEPAIQAYIRAGFQVTDYPVTLPIPNILYMTKTQL